MEIAFHKAIITPKEPSYICGHAARVHVHEGVLDELYISLLKVRSNREEYLFVSIDLVALDEVLVEQMKTIAVNNNIPKDHVILSVIHTHSAPEFTECNMFNGDPKTGARQGYRTFLVQRFGEALKGCDEYHEVTVSYGEGMIEGFYGNRNNITYPSDK